MALGPALLTQNNTLCGGQLQLSLIMQDPCLIFCSLMHSACHEQPVGERLEVGMGGDHKLAYQYFNFWWHFKSFMYLIIF